MGLQIPKSALRPALGTMLGLGLLLLGSCSAETKAQVVRFAQPATSPATEQAVYIADLWKWSWVALLVVGILVWGLMAYVSWRFRRRHDDEIPVQTRYNLPLEVFYTIAPIMMVLVLFFHTVEVQNTVLDEVPNPDHTVEVVGQQWSWTFNYPNEDAVDANNVYTGGTGSKIPTLVLEVDKTTQFRLTSPDVIHSFWIPAFLMKMDVIPGQVGDERNHFQVTPTKVGTFKGKCAELCGTYHSRMIFDVKVVDADEYAAYLRQLEADGFSSSEPLLGGTDAYTPAGQAETYAENYGGDK